MSDWRECIGGPMDGDRVDATYPFELEVVVMAPEDIYIRDLRHPDSPVPCVRCCTTKTHRPFNRRTTKKQVHAYMLCPQGHYHHARVK